MKTMLDTKIYNDNWFFSLSTEAKLLFLFLISNDSCNLIGCYELPVSIVSTYTGIANKKVASIFKELQPKVSYVKGWVIIKNYEKYNPMRNPSIEDAKKKQLLSIPQEIASILSGPIEGVDTLSTGYKETVTETEQVIRGIVKGDLSQITDEVIQEICKDYQVPESFVRSKMDDIKNYTASTGKKYKDYTATLRNWVKKDSLKIRKEAATHESKRGIDARNVE